MLIKDELKEAIADAEGAPEDVAASMRMGAAAYAVLELVARRVVEAEQGALIESNFRRGLSEQYFAPLLAHADARLVHCTAPRDVLRDRYSDRFTRGERHPAHLDDARAGALDDDLQTGRFEPPELGVPTLVVHTDGAYRPTLDAIIAFCREPA
jgi:predicted kinase